VCHDTLMAAEASGYKETEKGKEAKKRKFAIFVLTV